MVDAFVRIMGGIKFVKVLTPMWVSLNCFHIISVTPMCATIWIEHSEIAIVASSRINHEDWLMLE